MKSVYLAGPITGLTYDEGSDWRVAVKEELADHGIEAFSPLRAKEYLRVYGQLDSAGTTKSKYLGHHPLSDPPGIVARDRNDCTRKDMVLVNFLGAEIVSIGTCIELGWADAARVPIVIVMEEDNIHRHSLVNQLAGYITTDLEDALAIVKAVLLP